MSESIRWKEAFFCDGAMALTLEDSIRACATFGGVHDFDFGDDIDEAFADLSEWTVDTSDATTWSAVTGELVVVGGGGAVWHQGIHDTEVSPSFVASFDLVSGDGGFIFRGRTGTTEAYIAWWDGSNCGFGRISDAKVKTNLIVMPYGISTAARIQVAVKWRLDSVDDSRKWLLMTLFVDGREFAGYADSVGGTGNDWAGDEIGFACYDSDTLTVDNLTISEISRIVDYTAVDVDESPAAGMSRAIGTTRLKLQARFDGTMRVWRPGNRASDWTVPTGRAARWAQRDERAGALTHVRTIGAIHFVDRFDDGEGEAHMHRFRTQDDPNLMSESETYDEAGRTLNEAKEQQEQTRMMIEGQVLCEPFDRITHDGDEHRLISIHHTYAMEKEELRFSSQFAMQKYIAV